MKYSIVVLRGNGERVVREGAWLYKQRVAAVVKAVVFSTLEAARVPAPCREQLVTAAKDGDDDGVRAALQEGAVVNCTDGSTRPVCGWRLQFYMDAVT